MKSHKFFIALGIILLTSAVALWAVKKEFQIKLDVRSLTSETTDPSQKKQDLQLHINNKPQEIKSIESFTVSLGDKPDLLGRNFILSFHITEYGSRLREVLEFFVIEILTNYDLLIIQTPFRMYKMNVSVNKTKVIEDIESLVKRDCMEFKNKLSAFQQNLDVQIRRMLKLFRGDIRDPGFATSYKMIGTFLSTFPQGFIQFINQFLFSHPGNYERSINNLNNRDGERWWFHFQQLDTLNFVAKAKGVAKEIENYCSQHPLARQSFQNKLTQFKKQFQLADSFSKELVYQTLSQDHIHFNALLWMHRKPSESIRSSEFINQLRGMFEQVSTYTGGKTVYIHQLLQGFKQIVNHKDYFYQIIGIIESEMIKEKNTIHLSTTQPHKTDLIYLKSLTREKIQNLNQFYSQPKIHIRDFSINKSKISFSIGSIILKPKEQYGLVKVRIQLYDSGDQRVYQTENTLRSSNEKITLTIPIPSKFQGKFRLNISACDLIANQMTSLNQSIHLKD